MSFTQQTHHGVTFHTADAFSAAGGVAPRFRHPAGGREYRPLCPAEPGHHPPGRAGGGPGELPPLLRCHRRGRNPPGDDPPGPRGRDPGGHCRRRPPRPAGPHRLPGGWAGHQYAWPGLTIYYADCIPVLLYDPVGKAIAAVHSGWRGTSLGICPQGSGEDDRPLRHQPEDVLAAIGPGIGPCCFETHDDVPTALEDRLGPAVRPFCHPLEQAAGKFTVDLKGIIAWELRRRGWPRNTSTPCPCVPPATRSSTGPTGRWGTSRGNHAAMIALEG